MMGCSLEQFVVVFLFFVLLLAILGLFCFEANSSFLDERESRIERARVGEENQGRPLLEPKATRT
jgi:F0F1-type ATP synthase membrane subunit b/b'